MSAKLDIVIFGVTGFTGLRTIPYITRIIKANNLSLTWGVAGRSETKVKRTLKELGMRKGENYDYVPVIIADVNDENSLIQMTSRARIIINAIGPYTLYGEPVVKACLKTSTHHVDVSIEPLFMEKMQLLYHEEAKSKGIYIISACGLGCIPGDLGTVYLKNNFEGTLHSIETYAYLTVKDINVGGPVIHVGTFKSGVYFLGDLFQMYAQRKLLFNTKLPSMQPKLATHLVHKSKLIDRWCIALPEPDLSVTNRSQRYFYELYRERPIEVTCYGAAGSLLYFILTAFYAFWWMLLSQFAVTRDLLLQYPKIFSYGLFGDEGPSEERQEATVYHLQLRGKGWSERLQDPMCNPGTPLDKEIVAEVSGNNPAYGITCAALALSAVMILTEAEKMPDKGGVYPPGVAFAKTSIIEKLNENGVSFKIVSES